MGKKKKTEVPTTPEPQGISVTPSGNVQQLPAAGAPASAPQVSGDVVQGPQQSQATQPSGSLPGKEIPGPTTQPEKLVPLATTSTLDKSPSVQGPQVPPKAQIAAPPGMPLLQGPQAPEKTASMPGIQVAGKQDNRQAAELPGTSVLHQENQVLGKQSSLPQPPPCGKQGPQIPETLPSKAANPPEKPLTDVLEQMLQTVGTVPQGPPTQTQPSENHLHLQGKTAPPAIGKQPVQVPRPKESAQLPGITPLENVALQQGTESLEKPITQFSQKPTNLLPGQVPRSLVTQSTEKLNTQQGGQSTEKQLPLAERPTSQTLENSAQLNMKQPQPQNIQPPAKQPHPQPAQPSVKQSQQPTTPPVKQPQPQPPTTLPVKQPEPQKPTTPPAKQPEPQKPTTPPAKQPEPQKPTTPAKQPEPQKPITPPAKQPEPQKPTTPPARQPEPQQPTTPPVKQVVSQQPTQPPLKKSQPQQATQPPAKQLDNLVQSGLKELVLPEDKLPQSSLEKLVQPIEQLPAKLPQLPQQPAQPITQPSQQTAPPSEQDNIKLPEKPAAQPPEKQQPSGKTPSQSLPSGKTTAPQKVSVPEKSAPASLPQSTGQTTSSKIPASPVSQGNQPPTDLLQCSKSSPEPKSPTENTPISNIPPTAQTATPIQDTHAQPNTALQSIPVNPEISPINLPADEKTSTVEKAANKTQQAEKVQAGKQDKPSANKNDKTTNKQKVPSNVQDVKSGDKSSTQKSTKYQKASINKSDTPGDTNNTNTPELVAGKTEIASKPSNKTEDKSSTKTSEKTSVSKRSDNKNEKASSNKNAEKTPNKQNAKSVPKAAAAKSDNVDKLQNNQPDKNENSTTKSESKSQEKFSETKQDNKPDKKGSVKSEKEDNTSVLTKSDKTENKVTNSTEEKIAAPPKTPDTKLGENNTNAKSSAKDKTGANKPEAAEQKLKTSKQEKKTTQTDKAAGKTSSQPAPNKSDKTQKSNEKSEKAPSGRNKTNTDKVEKKPEKAQGKKSEKAGDAVPDAKAPKKEQPESKVMKDENASKVETTPSPKVTTSPNENIAAETVNVQDDNSVIGEEVKKKKKRGKRGRGKKAAAAAVEAGGETTISASQNAKKKEGSGGSGDGGGSGVPANTGGGTQETEAVAGEGSARKKNKKRKKKGQSSPEGNNVTENPKAKVMKSDEVTTTTQEKKKLQLQPMNKGSNNNSHLSDKKNNIKKTLPLDGKTLCQQFPFPDIAVAKPSDAYIDQFTKCLQLLVKAKEEPPPDTNPDHMTQSDDELEYDIIQRVVFLPHVCHICKAQTSADNKPLFKCKQCMIISYCSDEHQKEHWPTHRNVCHVIAKICRENNCSFLFEGSRGLSPEAFRNLRIQYMLQVRGELGRELELWEKEMFYFVSVCHTCYESDPTKLTACKSCSFIHFCQDSHLRSDHSIWCRDFKVYTDLVRYQSHHGMIRPVLPTCISSNYTPLSKNMHEHLSTLKNNSDITKLFCYPVLTDIATCPLTIMFALEKCFETKIPSLPSFTVHLVGAEAHFEMDTIKKWEIFILHSLPTLQCLKIVFVGPELRTDMLPDELLGKSTCCSKCATTGRSVVFDFQAGKFYHEYKKSREYSAPDIICAFNAGLYRSTGFNNQDTWPLSIEAMLSSPCAPVVVTAYTAEEIPLDVKRMQEHGSLRIILSPSLNPFSSSKPSLNFVSDEKIPLIYKNFHIAIVQGINASSLVC